MGKGKGEERGKKKKERIRKRSIGGWGAATSLISLSLFPTALAAECRIVGDGRFTKNAKKLV